MLKMYFVQSKSQKPSLPRLMKKIYFFSLMLTRIELKRIQPAVSDPLKRNLLKCKRLDKNESYTNLGGGTSKSK